MDTEKKVYAIKNNEALGQFEICESGYLAVAEYRRVKNRIIFTHTEVPPELEGKGMASQLAKTALDFAREEGLEVMPLCPFIAAYIRRHQEYASLVLPGFRY
ncbi:MAG: N-acetyltransferase [Sinomicrobium sp.]|nr:N-acetyltransferase [Sinomicrobium sp.]